MARSVLLGKQTRLLQQVTNDEFDIIHMDGLCFAGCLPQLSPVPVVLSTVDAISRGFWNNAACLRWHRRSLYYKMAARWVENVERRFLPGAQAVHVVSVVDAAYLHELCPQASLKVIPLCCDKASDRHRLMKPRADNRQRILIIANLRVPFLAEGVRWFLRNVLTKISRTGLEVLVVGRGAPKDIIKQVQQLPNVTLAEWVDDLYLEMTRASIMVFPDPYGTGMKTRVINALALGCPVVTTPAAIEGIECISGRHCFICDDPDTYAAAILRLLDDPVVAEQLGNAAARQMHEKYSETVVLSQWMDLYNQLATMDGQALA